MRHLIASALSLSLLISPITLQAGESGPTPIQKPSQSAVKLKNVELTEQGDLQGQYLNSAGQPVVGVTVKVTIGKEDQKVETDDRGRFSIRTQQGGRAVIQIGKETFACQLWQNGTAPPKSISSVAIVASNDDVVRGNMIHNLNPIHHLHHLNPVRLLALSGKQLIGLGLIAGGVTAIAVSANDDDDAS